MTTEGASSLSDRLRRAREERGETVEQVNQLIGISPKVLVGLESGQYDVVEPVYVHLALKSYAEHLKLDADELLLLLQNELKESPKPPPIAVASDAMSGALVKTGGSARLADAIDMLRRRPQSQRIALLGAVVLIVVALVLWLRHDDADNPVQTDRLDRAPGATAVTSPRRDADAARQPSTRSAAAAVAPTPAPSADPRESPVAVAATGPPPQTAQTSAEMTAAPASEPPEDVASDVPALTAPEPDVPQPDDLATDEHQPESVETASTISPVDTGESAATASVPGGSAAVTPVVAPLAEETPAAPPSGVLEAAPVGTLTLEGEAVDSTWVQVQWDGVDGIEEVIPRGQRRRWQAREFFMVKSGRAHGVRFHLDGTLLGNGRLGDPTEVLRFRASRDLVTLLSRDLQPLSQLSVEHDIAATD